MVQGVVRDACRSNFVQSPNHEFAMLIRLSHPERKFRVRLSSASLVSSIECDVCPCVFRYAGPSTSVPDCGELDQPMTSSFRKSLRDTDKQGDNSENMLANTPGELLSNHT